MDYRPITDVWILARPRVQYHGAYPLGFLHRARALLGVAPDGAVLHVCAGKIRDYPYAGLGPNDKTLDLDPACAPDYLHDVRVGLPWRNEMNFTYWDGALIDRPYTRGDAKHYAPGLAAFPELNLVLKHALGVVGVGCKEVAVIAVGTGRNNRARWFTVFERIR